MRDKAGEILKIAGDGGRNYDLISWKTKKIAGENLISFSKISSLFSFFCENLEMREIFEFCVRFFSNCGRLRSMREIVFSAGENSKMRESPAQCGRLGSYANLNPNPILTLS